jgi:hypothetical protein
MKKGITKKTKNKSSSESKTQSAARFLLLILPFL